VTVSYRAARLDDLPAAVTVFRTALADLYARTGVAAAPPRAPAVLAAYTHVRRTGTFHLAEADGDIVALASAVVRDDLWFLSAFWALPSWQRQGIGRPLLERVRQDGVRAGARIFFTWSSLDPPAMAVYLKMGMLPGFPSLVFGGVPQELPPRPAGCETAPLERRVAQDFDRAVRGAAREADHEHWLGSPHLASRQVIRGGRVAGYYYAGGGVAGPAAWMDPADADPILSLAMCDAAANGGEIRMSVPGVNHAAVRAALRAGLRLQTTSLHLTSAPFGRLDQYVASGPSLF